MIAGFALALLFSLAAAPAAAEENTILRFCMAAFEAAMANAGLTPPEGMGTFTCDCFLEQVSHCLLYTSPSPRDGLLSRMPSSA